MWRMKSDAERAASYRKLFCERYLFDKTYTVYHYKRENCAFILYNTTED